MENKFLHVTNTLLSSHHTYTQYMRQSSELIRNLLAQSEVNIKEGNKGTTEGLLLF